MRTGTTDFILWTDPDAYEPACDAINLAMGYPDGNTLSHIATAAQVKKDVLGHPIMILQPALWEQVPEADAVLTPLFDAGKIVEITDTQYWALFNEAYPPGDG